MEKPRQKRIYPAVKRGLDILLSILGLIVAWPMMLVIGLLVMFIRPDGIMKYLQGVDELVYLGLILNVGCIALLLSLVFKPSLVQRCAESTMGFIHRIRPFKKPEKIRHRLDNLMQQYTGTNL